MKTKTIEVCNALHIDITCALNDSTDMKCGGPPTVGYEFYVNPDENHKKLEIFIKKCLKTYGRPFMYMDISTKKDFPVKNLWTREKMAKCIKENSLGL